MATEIVYPTGDKFSREKYIMNALAVSSQDMQAHMDFVKEVSESTSLSEEEKNTQIEKSLNGLYELSESNKEKAKNQVKSRSHMDARHILRLITTIENYARYIQQDYLYDKNPSKDKIEFCEKMESDDFFTRLYKKYEHYVYEDIEETSTDSIITSLKEQLKELLNLNF